MWVAQITQPATQGEHTEQLDYLRNRFPEHQFGLMSDQQGHVMVISTAAGDEPAPHLQEWLELDLLRSILTQLLDDAITGIVITDL